jgi:phage replication O-like protein O
MKNPQIENGYTKIANELMEALCGIRIPGEARQCLDVIIRKTWGYNKRFDHIALSQFTALTGLIRPTVYRGIVKLAKMNLVIITKNDQSKRIGNMYQINKDFDSWKVLSKKITVNDDLGVIKKDNEVLSKKIQSVIQKDTYKRQTKRQLTKESIFFKNKSKLDILKEDLKTKKII